MTSVLFIKELNLGFSELNKDIHHPCSKPTILLVSVTCTSAFSLGSLLSSEANAVEDQTAEEAVENFDEEIEDNEAEEDDNEDEEAEAGR